MIHKIDGIRMRLVSKDIDGDGVTGGTENVQSHKDQGIARIKESSELGEALELQNLDIENEHRLSSVDFISRINNFHLAPLVAVDTISSMGVISRNARIVVKNIMRKAVSLEGKGRAEFVELATGKREADLKKASVQNMAGSNQKGG